MGNYSGKFRKGIARCRHSRNKLSEEERWQLVDYIRTFSQPSANAAPNLLPRANKGAAPK